MGWRDPSWLLNKLDFQLEKQEDFQVDFLQRSKPKLVRENSLGSVLFHLPNRCLETQNQPAQPGQTTLGFREFPPQERKDDQPGGEEGFGDWEWKIAGSP